MNPAFRSSALMPALVVVLALLAGCTGGLLPKPPAAPARYTLDDGRAVNAAALQSATPAAPASPANPKAPTLVLAMPSAAPGHDSTRMVYLRQPHQLEAFAYAVWVEPPAQMLAPLLQRALQDSGAFAAVLPSPAPVRGGWRLQTELVRLQQDFGTQPSQVRLTLRAVLVDSTTQRVLGAQEFDQTVAAASDDPVAGVAAAHLATQRVLAALAAYCAAQAQAATLR